MIVSTGEAANTTATTIVLNVNILDTDNVERAVPSLTNDDAYNPLVDDTLRVVCSISKTALSLRHSLLTRERRKMIRSRTRVVTCFPYFVSFGGEGDLFILAIFGGRWK